MNNTDTVTKPLYQIRVSYENVHVTGYFSGKTVKEIRELINSRLGGISPEATALVYRGQESDGKNVDENYIVQKGERLKFK